MFYVKGGFDLIGDFAGAWRPQNPHSSYNLGVTNTEGTANRQIARAAGVVMAAFILSNLIGLVRQILISEAFGTEGVIDAFNAAARIPDLIFSLVAGGALASAFVPTFFIISFIV